MDMLNNIVSAVADFDLEKENVNGIFTNLTLLSMLLSAIIKDRPFPITKEVVGYMYDYIIVGAGPAGSVMATRLSQNPCRKVLLLEAGESTPLLSEVPAFARLFFGSPIDWDYRTVPQKNAGLGLKEKRVPWNSGRGLGGGSILNALIHVRGNRRDYDRWEAEGATGWGYDDVLPYFIKLEDNKNFAELDEGFHQEGGLQTVERVNYAPEIKEPVKKAIAELGYTETDINGRNQSGFYNLQANLRNQRRCSTAKSYLVPADKRPNLDIVKGAFVKKIMIENGRAIGVEYDHPFKIPRTVRASKEVIVSCGSVRTAQLLMLSGIGPREELSKFNIEVKADLPVGQNLQDHSAANMMYLVNDTIQNVLVKSFNPVNIIDYIVNNRGPLAAPTQITAMAFTDGKNGSSVTTDWPRQELYFAEYSTIDAKLNSNLKEGVFKNYFACYLSKPLYFCSSANMRPKSRGQITINSTDPYVPPLIDPRYYENEDDLIDIVRGLEVCNAVARSDPMKEVQATLIPVPFPGCKEEFERNETEYLACYAKHFTSSDYHPVGVARMGLANDSRSVVDPQLRVIGVEGLRVVNAAVMPIIPSGNTMTPTMMIAEKAYDMMEEDAQCPDTKITVGPVTVAPGTVGPVTVAPGTVGPGAVGLQPVVIL